MSDWREALAPTAGCIAIERLGEELTPAEQAHLEACARCQSELALFREITGETATAEENDAAEWIAAELRNRKQENVVAFRPRLPRVLYSVAAALLIAIGAGWWLQLREPALGPLDPGSVYRSARIELVAPAGDLSQAPNELRWTPVPNASRYHVRIVEVDGTEVFGSETVQPSVTLPANVVAQFAPGKSLKWEVKAFRGEEMLAASETRTVRVSVTPERNTP